MASCVFSGREFRSGWRIYDLDQQPAKENREPLQANGNLWSMQSGKCLKQPSISKPKYSWGVEINPPTPGHMGLAHYRFPVVCEFQHLETWLYVVHTISFRGQKDSERSPSISEQTRDRMKHKESTGFVLF